MKYVEERSTGTHSVGYTYDGDNRPSSVLAGNSFLGYAYDAYGRVSTLTTKHDGNVFATKTYAYKVNDNGAPTNQVSGVTFSGSGQNKTYTYTYDQNGNITGINDGTHTTGYAYDSANQLIRENNQKANTTTVWTYDDAGNILKREVYPYTNGTLDPADRTAVVDYTYEDEKVWGDLLTAYNGVEIAYDNIGNPLNDGTWTYTWQHGRQLASMSKIGTSEQWQFTYNADGLRTKRTNGDRTYQYTYLGDKLTHMSVDGHTMYFTYDASGTPLNMVYDGHKFYYVTNLQGDVVAMINSSGVEVVQYTYDAWGNVQADGPATNVRYYNPLRYRGYVYDPETGLYYLQSRYYNPEMGRFVDADGFTSTGQGLLGNNMFVYCGNNPVSRKDIAGTRYCEATSVAAESYEARAVACQFQNRMVSERQQATQDANIIHKILNNITRPHPDGVTSSVGVNAGASWGSGTAGSVAGNISVDSSYTYALQGTSMISASTSFGIGASAGFGITLTNAHNVQDLAGAATVYGGTLCDGVGISFDLIKFVPSSAPNTVAWGVYIGITFGAEVEFHGGESFTTSRETWNPFKLLNEWWFG